MATPPPTATERRVPLILMRGGKKIPAGDFPIKDEKVLG